MKSFVLCLMAVSLTLAAPGARKRDIDIYTHHHLPGIRQETTTHYCPEEDIPAEFIPSPPAIQSFPLPSFPNLPIIKYDIPIPIHAAPVHHDHLPTVHHDHFPTVHHDHIPAHPEYLPPPPVRQDYIEPNAPSAPAPHESYGHPFPEYGLPGFRQETTTLPPPPTEQTTLPPPPPTETLPPQTTTTETLPPQTTTLPSHIVTEPPTTTITHKPIFHKLVLLKQHLKHKIKLPEIDFANPALVFNKRIEFPFLKNLFGEHQTPVQNVVERLVRQTFRH